MHHPMPGSGGAGARLAALARSRDAWAGAAIVAVVLIGNVLPVLGLVHADPRYDFSGLTGASHQLLPGYPVTDPNAGFTTQALGHLAALDWLHGKLPWWNPYEGLGAPLAGEMQSAALFPPVLLLALSWGTIPFHLLLEVASGLAAYALARRLALCRSAALIAGFAFASSGTLVLLANAPASPVPFLPLSVYAVVRAAQRVREGRRGGAGVLAVSVAGSLYAGFPETAYLDGLVALAVAAWAVATCPRGRWRLAGRLAGGAAAGAALAMPALVPFLDYLPFADLGGHSGTLANAALGPSALPQLLLPFAYGPMQAFSGADPTGRIAGAWDSLGGWNTAALALLALLGVLGRRQRGLRLTLAGVALLYLGRSYGVPVLWGAFNAVPGLRLVAGDRYSAPAWELALALLAAFAVDDFAMRRLSKRVLAGCATLVAACTVAAGAYAAAVLRPVSHLAQWYAYASLGFALVTVGALALLLPRCANRVGRAGVCLLVALNGAALIFFASLSSPQGGHLDQRAVQRLAAGEASSRTLAIGGVLQPNYGSYYGVAELDVNDLPVPKAYASYLKDNLDPSANPLLFTGTGASRTRPWRQPLLELRAHLGAYRDAGVGYLLAPTGAPVQQVAPLRRVASGPTVSLYFLPGAKPIASGPGCTSAGDNPFRVRCLKRSQLVYRELAMPGWTVAVDGRGRALTGGHGPFLAVAVPAGSSRVHFSYAPPHELLALGAFLVSGIALTASGLRRARPKG